MREILIGIAITIVIAVGAGIWLSSMQTSVAERYTVSTTVRL